jgi:dTMP kinase
VNKKRGIFITFEGCEGSGKSTQIELLVKHFKNAGYKRVLQAREPGGGGIAENIRKILLNPEYKVAKLAELLLYEANRAQNVESVVAPHLKKGFIVICDRYTDSTLAYQGYARGLDLKVIKTLNSIASEGLTPDLTIYLDVPARIGLKKARHLSKESYANGDRIEREDLKFHEKVRKGFLKIAKQEPSRIKVIKVMPTKEETHSKVVETVRKELNI